MHYEEISLEMPIKYGLATYYMIGTSEASTNLSKYCGMRYGASEKLEGSFNEYFTKVRSTNLGEEAKEESSWEHSRECPDFVMRTTSRQ